MLFANRVALIDNLNTHQIGAKFLIHATPCRDSHGDFRPFAAIFNGIFNQIVEHFGQFVCGTIDHWYAIHFRPVIINDNVHIIAAGAKPQGGNGIFDNLY